MEREQREHLQKLMVRLSEGDRSAFDPLYETLWPLILRFTSKALGGSAFSPYASDAEDAAQVALMKVFSRASVFDGERDALSWILGVAAYECKTFRQRERRRREDTGMEVETVGLGPNPEETAIASNLELAAAEVLGTLRPADVETLAAVMAGHRPEVPAATFRKRAERAIGRLRAAWRLRHGAD